ncbi:MAG: polymer-forming cytoskeletal protein [Haliscomenobacter sp.]|nr:polymer-forming cytoskeletal protein [Haliscomenobacter sp.]MBK8653986.1 polymer-forming cytoskeletal protein [Haliscomenobacter sp.]MBP9077812.1 polymer-forming cytoskeletal protein [Haliscomenobacter sp.]
MFGTNKTESPKGGTPAAGAGVGNSFNSLVAGTTIEGTVRSEKDIRIEGKIKGKLFCDAKVVIGPSGQIEGEMRCVNAVIEGKMDGALFVKELLNIRDSAQVSGDVTTGKLVIQSGAVFNVNCTMGGQHSAPATSAGPAKAAKDGGMGQTAPESAKA